MPSEENKSEARTQDTDTSAAPPANWEPARPAHIPEPTFWPAVLALGVIFVLWGVITTPIVTIIGLGVSALSIGKWIGELWHERQINE